MAAKAASTLAAADAFAEMQLARQGAGLTSNTRKQETAESASLVIQNHDKALKAAMSDSLARVPLTLEVLCQIHAILCSDGLCDVAGAVRKTGVNVGNRQCLPPDRVEAEIRLALESVEQLSTRADLSTFAKAAAAAMAVAYVHPFKDGNGRMARIAANMVLRRAGVPFVLNICGTEEHRRRYVAATVASHTAGTLSDMSSLLAEHCARAWEELERLQQRREAEAADTHLAEAVRAAREQARSATCLICLGDAPNIATLCCGAASHLNCLASWLTSGSHSCVQCRSALPAPVPRPLAPAPAAPAEARRGNPDPMWVDPAMM